MDLQLTGKRAVVTGASRGIGLAVAKALAAEGTDIVLVARNREALETAAAQVAEHGTRTLAIPTDTNDDDSVRATVARAVTDFGGVDILVNSAAQPAAPGSPRTLATLVDADLRSEIETKVLGYVRCARAVAPSMLASGWGRIINISGLAARQTGSPFGSIRNVAVAALTKNLADELGPKGVNVTVVHPGMTYTERMPALLAAAAAAEGITEAEAEARMAARNSIKHLVSAEEVANVVTFLASPLSVAINGDTIAAGGGAPGSIYY